MRIKTSWMDKHAHIITLDDRNDQDVKLLADIRKLAQGTHHIKKYAERRERAEVAQKAPAAVFPGSLGGGDRPDA